MALDVGTLVANLKLDRKDFDKGVTESEGRFSKLAGTLGAAAVKVGAVAGGVIVAAGAVGLRTAASMEQAEIGFTTMLGSGAKAQAFLGELSAFAAKTPFAFPELQTAASSLISAGIEADKVIPIMTTLGDVTSGMGTGSEGVKRATIALQQMNAAGRITGEDLNQLRDAGIPVYDLLANATGKTKAEVVALAQAGKLGKTELDAMMKALETGGGLEKFTGLMEKQSQSLTGLWSTLKDTFSMGMASAIQPLIPLIKDGLGGAISGVAGFMPKLSAGLATTVAGLSEFIAGVTMSKGETAAYGAALDGAASVGNRVGVVIRTVAGAVREFAAGLTMSTAAASAVGGSMDGLSGAGARVRLALVQAKEAVTGMFPTNATGGIDFAATLDRVEAGARKLWPQVKEAGASLAGLGPVLTVTGAVFGFFADHIDTVVQYMPLLIAGFIAWKTAQALSLAVQIAHLPITIALAASNLAYASAVYALLAAMGIERTSRIASIAAWAVHLVQIVAHNVALLALRAGIIITTGAMYAITAAQWLLNAALTANPIGLVIAAIALLVGGLILAYKNSETFRNIVDGAFRAVGAAATWLWDMAIKPAFAFISDAMGAVKRTTLNVVGELVGAWFWWADKLLMAAEKALGWIPGLGDKVTQARQGMAAVGGAIQGEIDKLQGKDIVLDVKANGSYTMSAGRAANEHTGIANRATGGAIHGWGTGTSDSIPALLSDDEHVWTAEEVQKAGGHSRMYALRAAVRSGALGAYATGGAVMTRAAANIGRIVPEQYDPTERALLSGIATTVGSGIAAAQAAAASASSASSAPGGVAGRGNVDAELLRRFDAWNASMGGVLRIVSGYRSSAKQAQLYAAYLNGTGNLAARPGSSNHEKSPARAIDYGPASWARTPGSYAYGLKAPVRSEPWHLERAFDEGGIARGSGMMPKFNPRPERVLSPRQTEAFERLVDVLDDRVMGGSAVMGGVTYSGTVNVVDPEEFARRTVARQRDAAAVAGLTSIL